MEPPRNFTFDAVYDWNSKQVDLFEETFRDLIESVLNGFNGTIFAYGQTGTGKTFTMEGWSLLITELLLSHCQCGKEYSSTAKLFLAAYRIG